MQTTKYIRHAIKGFVLWDVITEVSHLQMATQMFGGVAELYSAGFVMWAQGRPVCNGFSGSLGVGCKPGDSEALARQLHLEARAA